MRYYEPNIGIAAVKVLEALGFEVERLKGRKCCGRPAFSQGNLDEAKRVGARNLALLRATDAETPILFLEPSCYSMFAEDYRELSLADAPVIAPRSFLFEKFVADLLDREPDALLFRETAGNVAIHAHCHAKALIKPLSWRAWRSACRDEQLSCWRRAVAEWQGPSERWIRNTNYRCK